MKREKEVNRQTSSPCETCPAHNAGNLLRLGINMEDWDYVVALAGNPNTGKSTVFNALTGLRQHTGNWPGKTVSRAEGGFGYGEHRYKLVDLPGTYSLLATSLDEEVARLHLEKIGVKLDTLTNKQAKYLGIPKNGPFIFRYRCSLFSSSGSSLSD